MISTSTFSEIGKKKLMALEFGMDLFLNLGPPESQCVWWCLVGVITIVQCIFGAFWVQYIFDVASLVLFIVSYIAQACYRSGTSTLSLTPTGTLITP